MHLWHFYNIFILTVVPWRELKQQHFWCWLISSYGLNRLKALCELYISAFISGAPMADIGFSVIGKTCYIS